jgi:RecA-family ATPase
VSAVEYDAGDVPFDLEARQRFNTKVAELYEKRMANAEVDTIVRAEEFEASYRPAQVFPNAAEGLKIDWPPIEYGVDRLVTKGGIVLITAGYKTGKTDLMFNLLRSYADETPFLGEFEVAPLDEGRQVMMLDFELDENYSWALLKMQQIQRPERANLITYRGRSFDIQNDEFRQRFTEMLVGLGVQVLIVDPFGAAFHGEENSNTEVRAWLEALKVVQAECGIREVFHHDSHRACCCRGRARASPRSDRA